jgi:hypothetical protein
MYIYNTYSPHLQQLHVLQQLLVQVALHQPRQLRVADVIRLLGRRTPPQTLLVQDDLRR